MLQRLSLLWYVRCSIYTIIWNRKMCIAFTDNIERLHITVSYVMLACYLFLGNPFERTFSSLYIGWDS